MVILTDFQFPGQNLRAGSSGDTLSILLLTDQPANISAVIQYLVQCCLMPVMKFLAIHLMHVAIFTVIARSVDLFRIKPLDHLHITLAAQEPVKQLPDDHRRFLIDNKYPAVPFLHDIISIDRMAT